MLRQMREPLQRTTLNHLPTILHQDLQTLDKPLALKNPEDLNKIRELAINREMWRELQQNIVETAEASQSIDRNAKGP